MEKKKRYVFVLARDFDDIYPLELGSEEGGPIGGLKLHIRSSYIIHYVASGKGIFKTRRGEYEVSAGQIFIIRPGDEIAYKSDDNDPWYYIWVGFNGKLAKNLNKAPDVLDFNDYDMFEAMFECEKHMPMLEVFLAGKIMELLSKIFEKAKIELSDTVNIAQQVSLYINRNYMQDISVDQLSERTNISRRYLLKLFKAKYGVTLKEHIIRIRMENAMKFLKNSYSVAQTAQMCGYSDTFNFSKMFKKFYGISPSSVKAKK